MAKETQNGPQKRAAPITASAFAFSLNTNTPKNKKTKSSSINTPLSLIPNPTQTPSRVKREVLSTTQPPSFNLSQVSHTPLRTLKQEQEDDKLFNVLSEINPSETPRKPSSILKPLNAFSTPLAPHTNKIGDPGPSSSKTLRRLNDRIAEVTPLKDKEAESEIDSKPRFALHETLLPEKTTGDLLSKKRAALLDEDEGLGVSPRGKRIAKWNGNGPPPPSVHLANLLSSSNASLHLFYTSMQHLLYPSQRPSLSSFRSRQPKTENVTQSTSPFQHITNSATIRLKLIQPIQGPTHNSVVFLCEPVKWHNDDIPSQQITVVFQPVPNECPKLGIDPRLLSLRMKDQGEKQWQVGVWAWSEVETPVVSPSMAGREENMDEDGAEKNSTSESVSMFIVTRYLIVEQPVV